MRDRYKEPGLTRKSNVTARAPSVSLLAVLFFLFGRRIVPVETLIRSLGYGDIDVFHHDDSAGRDQRHRFQQDSIGQSLGGQGDAVDFEIEGAGTSMDETGLSRPSSA
jgi:hypothetical protein